MPPFLFTGSCLELRSFNCLLHSFSVWVFRWSKAKPEGDPLSESLSAAVCEAAHSESKFMVHDVKSQSATLKANMVMVSKIKYFGFVSISQS